jgi:hypothetical protein
MEMDVQVDEQHHAKYEDRKHGLHSINMSGTDIQRLYAYLYATIISYKFNEELCALCE